MFVEKRYIFFVLIALLTVSCATSPTGRPQLMIVSEDVAIAASKQAYTEMLEPYEKQGKIDTDPALKGRVYKITGHLIAQAIKIRPETKNWGWSIKIINDPETVNAWAMAGGKMALYTGLVEKLEATDDELAQVLGHEIAHALAKHSAEKMSVYMASSIGVGLNWQQRLVMTLELRSPSGRRWPTSVEIVLLNFSAHIRLQKNVRKSLRCWCQK